MAFSKNILPDSGAYYTLSNASIVGSDLKIEAGGYAELNISKEMLPTLTSKMLVVVHPSVFSSAYTNDAVQVEISVVTIDGEKLDFLIAASETSSGVFNTEIDLPVGEYTVFNYKISSAVPVTIYNWELCSEQSEEMTAVIEGVEQSLPRLLYDYNMYAYSVAQQELTVGLISCYLLSATDLQGHFTLSFFATERCNVHVRIKDNSVTELYSPHVFTVEKGYSSISIPHAYISKLATDHAFSVTVQCTNGQLSIPVRGMLYTIDGGYLATRLLDAGVDIEDISIKQLPTDNSPSEIWAIGFESTQLLLKKRAYNQLQRVNWEAVKDFGEGTMAAVEFHGSWINRDNADRFTLETENSPFVFVVDLKGTLRVYQGESFEDTYELDTNVTAVSACQGYASMSDAAQTHGMVIAYVKNGNVYYRQWLYNETISEYMWYGHELLYSAGDALFVSVHRLPDYRLGILVEHSAGTKWYITYRTYVGQAVKPELLKCRADDFVVCSVFDSSMAPNTTIWPGVQNTFEPSEYFNGFIMSFDGPLVFLNNTSYDTLVENITVTVNNTTVSIKNLIVKDNRVEVWLNEDVYGSKTVVINFNCPYLFMRAYNNCYATIQQSFTWVLPAMPRYIDVVERIGTNVASVLNLAVKPLVDRSLLYTEQISTDVSATLDMHVRGIVDTSAEYHDGIEVDVSCMVSIKVLQVGDTPL